MTAASQSSCCRKDSTSGPGGRKRRWAAAHRLSARQLMGRTEQSGQSGNEGDIRYVQNKRGRVPTDICTSVFGAALFTRANRQKRPKCPSVNDWMNKMQSIHSMEYYSALKRNDTLIHFTRWMDPEGIRLSEISQSQEDQYCMSPHIEAN